MKRTKPVPDILTANLLRTTTVFRDKAYSAFPDEPCDYKEFVHCDFLNIENCFEIDFGSTKFDDVEFIHCTFDGCTFSSAKFLNCKFKGVTFRNCLFIRIETAQLVVEAGKDDRRSLFENCGMERAMLSGSRWEHTDFRSPHVSKQHHQFQAADLCGSKFENCNFHDTNFRHARVDTQTAFEDCEFFNADTTAVDLKIVGGIKQHQAEQLIITRRMKYWERAFATRDKRFVRRTIAQANYFLVKLFWKISNYGTSTATVIQSLVYVWIATAVVGWLQVPFQWTQWQPSGWEPLMEGVWCNDDVGIFYPLNAFGRSVYHTIVAMLAGESNGYGPNIAVLGHVLYIWEVVVGWVTFFALATRLQISFTETP